MADKGTDSFVSKRWRDIRVGDIVMIQRDEYFPADLILLNSSEANGLCYVETKNLDGETNMKHKTSINQLS